MLPARQRQRPDPVQHVAEQPAVQMPLGQQQPVIPRVLDQPAAGLHQPVLQARQRPTLDPVRQSAVRGSRNWEMSTSGPSYSSWVKMASTVRSHDDLPKDLRWSKWLYTSLDAYRKLPQVGPVVLDSTEAQGRLFRCAGGVPEAPHR